MLSSRTRIPVGLFGGFVLTRVAASAINYVLPDLEPNYIRTARAVFEHTGVHALYFPIPYPALLYGVNMLVGNWLLTTHLLFVVASTVSVICLYLLVRPAYGEAVARKAVILAMVIPNYTAAVVGYSHTPVVGHAFLMVLLYAFYRLTTDGDDWRWYVVATAAGTAVVLVRPETILCFILLLTLLAWTRVRDGSVARMAGATAVMCGVLFAVLYGFQHLAMRIDPSERFGLLGNLRYSYSAFINTLPMRASGGLVDTEVAYRLGEQAFGSAEANDYSIPRAIWHNPREAAGNLGYNLKSLLKEAGHPLFMPIFLMPLVGIGLISRRHAGTGQVWLILASVVPATLASVLLTHVEVRYLMPLVMPLLVLMAVGLEDMSAAGWRGAAPTTYALSAAVSLTYLMYFRGVVS